MDSSHQGFSFIIMFVGFIHIIVASRHGLFVPLYEYITIYPFFHCIVDGHLSCFQIRVIVNSVAVNILELVFWQVQ